MQSETLAQATDFECHVHLWTVNCYGSYKLGINYSLPYTVIAVFSLQGMERGVLVGVGKSVLNWLL